MPTGRYATDLLGHPPFTRLTVVARGPNGPHGHAQWWCDCTCGARILLPGISLTSGRTQSCGCLHKEIMEKRNTTHGMAHRPEYGAWKAMTRRCSHSEDAGYANYGGRGITVCDAWQESFPTFYAEMGPRPGPGYTLERKNNDGPYEETNCVWATQLQQGRNRRTNRLLTYNGMTQCVTAWADELHIHPGTIRSRLRSGWSDERTLTTPVESKYRRHIP